MDNEFKELHRLYGYSILSLYSCRRIAAIGVFATFLVIVLFWERGTRLDAVLAQLPIVDKANTESNSVRKWAPDTIHLCMTVNGFVVSRRLWNTIRSILYYQNRVHLDRPGCVIQIDNATTLSCPKLTKTQNIWRPMHLHIISDRNTQGALHEILLRWALDKVTWSFYSMDDNEFKVKWVLNYHSAGLSAMIKLVIPDLLPETVEKVITVDTDMLFNHDITELWDHFEKFNSEQMLGFAWEQQSWAPDCKETVQTVIPWSGINGGLALLHLKRMRQMNWENLWHTVERMQHFKRGYLVEGEQEIFRTIIRKIPQVYYKLPCEWNVQVYKGVAARCCPVVWPLRAPDETDCSATLLKGMNMRLVKLVHYDTGPKPTDEDPMIEYPAKLTQIQKSLTTQEVRDRFHQMFHKFSALPLQCFH